MGFVELMFLFWFYFFLSLVFGFCFVLEEKETLKRMKILSVAAKGTGELNPSLKRTHLVREQQILHSCSVVQHYFLKGLQCRWQMSAG